MTYANEHPELQFEVTRIGCGLAGYKDEQIAPFFTGAPSNCQLPEEWWSECKVMLAEHQYPEQTASEFDLKI